MLKAGDESIIKLALCGAAVLQSFPPRMAAPAFHQAMRSISAGLRASPLYQDPSD